jgi:hypothetical protein
MQEDGNGDATIDGGDGEGFEVRPQGNVSFVHFVFLFVCLLITKTFHHLSCRREEQESTSPLIAPKEDGTKDLCQVFTENDAEGGASERPVCSAA